MKKILRKRWSNECNELKMMNGISWWNLPLELQLAVVRTSRDGSAGLTPSITKLRFGMDHGNSKVFSWTFRCFSPQKKLTRCKNNLPTCLVHKHHLHTACVIGYPFKFQGTIFLLFLTCPAINICFNPTTTTTTTTTITTTTAIHEEAPAVSTNNHKDQSINHPSDKTFHRMNHSVVRNANFSQPRRLQTEMS